MMSLPTVIASPSPLSGGTLGVLDPSRPSIGDCSSAGKFAHVTSRRFSQEWRNTSNIQKLKGLGFGVRRPVVKAVDGRKPGVVATTQAQSSERAGRSSGGESPAAGLRRILKTPGVHQGPACFDALSARLVEQAGFGFAFMSGFAVSAVRLGAPDVGLLSYGEVLEQGRLITSAVSIPIIGDGDNGYGNALNVKRTVKGFMQAGFAGILIEDQVSPKSCGHFGGKRVVSREEALLRIKAAVDARSEASGDIVIIARSDARQAESLEEALWRVQQFAKLGADVLFVDALASKDEMLAFCRVAPKTPKMANMLEGGGRTPILSPMELGELGFKLIAYPLSLVGVSIRAMQDALKALKSGRLPPPGDLPTFNEIKEVVGIKKYYEEDERYASLQFPTSSSAQEGTSDVLADTDDTQADAGSTIPLLGGDIVRDIPELQGTPEDSAIVPEVLVDDNTSSSSQGSLSSVWSRNLRVKVTGSTGNVKLDVRIPAGFLEGLSSTIPGIAGFNVKKLLNDAIGQLKGNMVSGQQLVDFTDRRGDRIQVFLE